MRCIVLLIALTSAHALPQSSLTMHGAPSMRLRGAGGSPLSVGTVKKLTMVYAAVEGTAGWLLPDEGVKLRGLPYVGHMSWL